ncbi:Cytochrome P450 2J6 [Dissostichus eleginoides]|uniref:Cytochrome P450 2J6 n=1 Tax=Dissostichus eleginoides TaxID=100907 RepID=A0AAD9FDB9_DISEL|nr:Cytochrome P450 2J6 [Dissostichus eleginoides]
MSMFGFLVDLDVKTAALSYNLHPHCRLFKEPSVRQLPSRTPGVSYCWQHVHFGSQKDNESMTKLAGTYGDVLGFLSSVVFSSGNIWKQQRRFALSTLRIFGFGKKSLEPIVLDEFTYCAQYFNSFKGKPLNPHIVLNNTVSNIIWFLDIALSTVMRNL